MLDSLEDHVARFNVFVFRKGLHIFDSNFFIIKNFNEKYTDFM